MGNSVQASSGSGRKVISTAELKDLFLGDEYAAEAENAGKFGLVERAGVPPDQSCGICLDDLTIPYVACSRNHGLHLHCYLEMAKDSSRIKCIYQCGNNYSYLYSKERAEQKQPAIDRQNIFLSKCPVNYLLVMEKVENGVISAEEKFLVVKEQPRVSLLQLFCHYRELYLAFTNNTSLQHTLMDRRFFNVLCNLKMNSRKKQLEFLRFLVRKKVSFEERLKSLDGGRTCGFFDVCDTEELRAFLEESKEDVSWLLRAKVMEWGADKLELLVARVGVGNGLLHQVNDEQVVSLLLANGANLEEADEKGLTPLYTARTHMKVRLLIRAGARYVTGGKLKCEITSFKDDDLSAMLFDGGNYFGNLPPEELINLMQHTILSNKPKSLHMLETIYSLPFNQELFEDIPRFLHLYATNSSIIDRFEPCSSNRLFRIFIIEEIINRMYGDITRELAFIKKLLHDDICWNTTDIEGGKIAYCLVLKVDKLGSGDAYLALQTFGLEVSQEIVDKLLPICGSPLVVQYLAQQGRFELDTLVGIYNQGKMNVLHSIIENKLLPERLIDSFVLFMIDNNIGLFCKIFYSNKEAISRSKSLEKFAERLLTNGYSDILKDVIAAVPPEVRRELLQEQELHELLRAGDYETLAGKMDALQSQVNRVDSMGELPLYIAIYKLDERAVRLLLERGAKPNEVCKRVTPLQHAFTFYKEEIVEHLINYGADVTAPDAYGQSPLHYAILHNSERLVRLLLERGLRPTLANIKNCKEISMVQLLAGNL